MEDVWGSQSMDTTKRRSYTQKFGDSTDTKSAGELTNSKSSSSSSSSSSSKASMVATSCSKRNTSDLLLALTPPIIVTFVFSGRLSLIVLCFGSLICYILDLADFPEATLACAGLTIVGIFGAAIWAAQFLILESYLNMTILAILGILLLYLFFVISFGFVTLQIEFQRIIPHLERVLFQSLPLVASSFLTWFLCIEISTLDLPICFCSIYFIYLMWLGKPRISSIKDFQNKNSTGNSYSYYAPKTPPQKTIKTQRKEGFLFDRSPSYDENSPDGGGGSGAISSSSSLSTSDYSSQQQQQQQQQLYDNSNMSGGSYILSIDDLIDMYIIPLIFTPTLYIVVHHNIITFSVSTLLSILEAIVFPLLLVSIALERHIQYFPWYDQSDMISLAIHTKYFSTLFLFCCIQRHPLFDELKGFAGFVEPTSSFLICSIGISLYIAISVSNIEVFQPGFQHVATNVCITFAAFMIGCILDLSYIGLLIIMIGSIAIRIVYQKSQADRGQSLQDELLVFLAALSAIYVTNIFFEKTLYFLNFDLTFQGGYRFPPELFCSIESMMACIAVAGPALLASSTQAAAAATTTTIKNIDFSKQFNLGYVSGMKADDDDNTMMNGISLIDNAKSWLFFVVLHIISITLAIMELIIRDQDWYDYGTTPGDVYPSYLLVLTSACLLLTAFHLININMISNVSVTLITLVQIGKLLHLFGLPSPSVFAAITISITYSLPFIVYFMHTGLKRGYEMSISQQVSYTLLFVILALIGTHHGGFHIASLSLSALLSKSATNLEIGCITTAAWLLLFSAVLALYSHTLVLLRTLTLCLSGFLILISTESLGPLRLTIDPTSSTYLMVSLHPNMTQGGNHGIYVIITAILVISAVTSIFNVHRPLPRLLFILSLSYCIAQILLDVAFPASMGLDSPHYGMLELPWVCTFWFTIFTCTVTIRAMNKIRKGGSSSSSSSSSKSSSLQEQSPFTDNIFIIWILIPLFFFGWAFLENSFKTHCLGLMFVSAAQYGVCCIVVRSHSFISEFQPSSHNLAGHTEKSTLAFISWSALIAFFWAFCGCLYSPHIACDIGIPLASLILCTTPKGFLVSNTSGLQLALMITSIWWTLSAIHSTTIRGHSRAFDAFHTHYNSENYLFGDYDVSFWTQKSLWTPLLNVFLIFVPYPSFYFSSKYIDSSYNIIGSSSIQNGPGEDSVFMMAIINALPILLAGVWSIRFLGLLGLVVGTHHCSKFYY